MQLAHEQQHVETGVNAHQRKAPIRARHVDGSGNRSSADVWGKAESVLRHHDTADSLQNEKREQQSIHCRHRRTLKRIFATQQARVPRSIEQVMCNDQNQHRNAQNLVRRFTDEFVCHQKREHCDHCDIHDLLFLYHAQ